MNMTGLALRDPVVEFEGGRSVTAHRHNYRTRLRPARVVTVVVSENAEIGDT